MSINRTTVGLRDLLFDELEKLVDGKSNPERASAVAKATCQIINTAKLELAYAKFATDVGNITKINQIQLSEKQTVLSSVN